MCAKNFILFLLSLLLIFQTESREINEIVENLNKSEKCFSDIQKLINTKEFDKMLKTWSNFSKDYLYGNSFDFGDFESCLTFDHVQQCFIQYQYKQSSNHSVISVLPKVSLLNFYLKNINERFGGAICIPDTCTGENVRNLMTKFFEKSEFEQSMDYDQSYYCQHKKTRFKYDTLRIISIICLLTITILVTIGTILTNSTSSIFLVKFLQCFSIRRNFQTLKDFSTKESTITCINGIKAISTIAIFFFHSFLIKISYPFSDGKNLQSLLNENKLSYSIATFTIVIDTFFIVSGVLIGRSLLNSKHFNFWKFFIQRYMRLTLLTLFLICYNAMNYSLFKLTPKPYAYMDYMIIDDCKNYWWTTALNIQTFVNPKHMCVVQAWFASVLFQLIIFAALIHMMLKYMSKTKVFICYGLLMLYGIILRLLVFTTRDSYYDVELGRVMDMSNDILEDTYYTLYTRVFSFFSGVFLAHIFYQTHEFSPFNNAKLNKIIIKSAFYSSVILIMLCPFVSWPVPKYLAIIIGLLWIVATNIVIYACHKNYGGIINDFLSLKIWIPISKMALSIYLVSLCHQGALTVTRTKPYEIITTSDIIVGFIFDALIAILPTLLIYTAVECSITNLANLITEQNDVKNDKN
ncbi:hypothetical protein PVAND_005253 [Polypedilum vanderplanki]|uniref:Nose resistant to fluoxetine protein 6-like protein n=1 Tax=Polypedilum vanderplanki TaxID=319348 RepID=A0A9J6BZU9_POLVA|nr:hypothetical protein PVAND_005253 [Polypedilum vanderplanki]